MDRNEILSRFEHFLDSAMTGEEPPPGIPAEILEGASSAAPGTDWCSIWSAMTALTQEVKLQGRAFKQLTETLSAEAENRGRRESLDALLDVRERLLRGLDTVRARRQLQPGLLDRIFKRRWAEIEHALAVVTALEEGYRLSLASLDDLLFRLDVQPIDCEDQSFDPRRMNAIDVEESDRVPDGTVLFVYRTGYACKGETYRPAQVRVARRRTNGVSNE
jgi:hypothetical protein